MAEETTIGTGVGGAGSASQSGDAKWARQEAEHFQEELMKKGESLLSEQKGTLSTLLNGIANALDKSAPHFEEEGQPTSARYTRQAAESLHGVARSLRERDLESIRTQVTDLARRQPALIAGGAVALGFLASRFFRSTSARPEAEYGAEKKGAEEPLIIGSSTGFQAGTPASSPIPPGTGLKTEDKEIPH